MASADVATVDAKITATNLIILSSIPSNLVERCVNSALPRKFNGAGWHTEKRASFTNGNRP
jgi:pyruvoyl-dependent arginine decarboxylase (PvlArgDC)